MDILVPKFHNYSKYFNEMSLYQENMHLLLLYYSSKCYSDYIPSNNMYNVPITPFLTNNSYYQSFISF